MVLLYPAMRAQLIDALTTAYAAYGSGPLYEEHIPKYDLPIPSFASASVFIDLPGTYDFSNIGQVGLAVAAGIENAETDG